jgi:hypothetical protein
MATSVRVYWLTSGLAMTAGETQGRRRYQLKNAVWPTCSAKVSSRKPAQTKGATADSARDWYPFRGITHTPVAED